MYIVTYRCYIIESKVKKMYSVGDKVAHPMHGAGIVQEIRRIDIAGKKQDYYAVKFAVGSMITNIPIDSSQKVGLRDILTKDGARNILETFVKLPISNDTNWNKRQRENLIKIKSGDIYQVLEVLKDLMYRDRIKGLSTNERKTLNNAKQIVVSELVLSDFATQSEVENIMKDTIDALVDMD